MIKFYRLFYSKTPKIKDSEGNVIEGSIASLEKIKLGEVDQWILIRGNDIKNPIILFLHRGPGNAEIAIAHAYHKELEKYYTVVRWDQRDAGKSYSKEIPVGSMTVEKLISDTRDLVEKLLERFNKDKLYLVGHSSGSELGMRVIDRYPELFHAYIGIGQVVYSKENEQRTYQKALELARDAGNIEAIQELENLAPYEGLHEQIEVQRKWLTKLGGAIYKWRSWAPLYKIALSSPEYNILDLLKYFKGFRFSAEAIADTTRGTNFFKEIPEVKIPVYFCVGKHDYLTVCDLVEEYFKKLKAPKKEIIWFEKSGHMPNYEEPEKFQEVLISLVK